MTYDYIYLENVIYFNKIFYIKNSKYNNQDLEKYFELNTIKVIDKNLPQPQTFIKNTFICETLHGCWAHAVIDYAFAYFWCLDEIKQTYNINDEITMFITEKEIKQYSNQKKSIDNKLERYKGAKNDLCEIINSNNIIFEHLENKSILFKNCFVYAKNHFNFVRNRTPWNLSDYYPGQRNKISLYSDSIIKKYLIDFKDKTYRLYDIKPTGNSIPNIIIINRKGTRNIDRLTTNLMNFFINNKKNYMYNFNSIEYNEDKTLLEQINLLINNDIIITPHGANLSNMIWTTNKIFIEIVFDSKNNIMYKRIAEVTNNTIYQIKIDQIENFLLKNLNKIIKKVNV